MKLFFAAMLFFLVDIKAYAYIIPDLPEISCELKKSSDASYGVSNLLEFYYFCDGDDAKNDIGFSGYSFEFNYKGNRYRKDYYQDLAAKTLEQIGISVMDDTYGVNEDPVIGRYTSISSDLNELEVIEAYVKVIRPIATCINDDDCLLSEIKKNFFEYFFDKTYIKLRKNLNEAKKNPSFSFRISDIYLYNPRDFRVVIQSLDRRRGYYLSFYVGNNDQVILYFIGNVFY